jgi:hypothetical protein
MAATKITALTAVTTMASEDLIPVVADPGGSPANRKITYSNFYANVAVTAKFSNTLTLTANVTSNASLTANNLYVTYRTTPGTSTDTVTSGKIWFDTGYLYVATATNTIKRIPLNSF